MKDRLVFLLSAAFFLAACRPPVQPKVETVVNPHARTGENHPQPSDSPVETVVDSHAHTGENHLQLPGAPKDETQNQLDKNTGHGVEVTTGEAIPTRIMIQIYP